MPCHINLLAGTTEGQLISDITYKRIMIIILVGVHKCEMHALELGTIRTFLEVKCDPPLCKA